MSRMHSWLRGRRLLSLIALLSLAVLYSSVLAQWAAGQAAAPPYVVRVEEDWTLTVNQPEGESAAPQVSTQMARSPLAWRFVNFHLNSCDLPQFSSGGLQLQTWFGNTNEAVYTSPNGTIMGTDNELVTWTQYLDNTSGQLVFGISAASSTTWGNFSGMSVTVPSGHTSLDNYSADYSAANSGITYGANRVASLVLVANRMIYSDGTIVTDNTPRVIYSAVLDSTISGGN